MDRECYVAKRINIMVSLAVLLHEIRNFGVLLHAGFGKGKVLWLNFLSASLAIVGASLALLIGARLKGIPTVVLPLTAGGFNLAGSDLVPELHKERNPLKSAVQCLRSSWGLA